MTSPHSFRSQRGGKREGTPFDSEVWLTGGGNKPIPLDDGRCWIVRRGHFDVFGAETGSQAGPRHHLFRTQVGDILCGVGAAGAHHGAGDFTLLAVGSLDSAVQEIDPSAEVEAASAVSWIGQLSEVASATTVEAVKKVATPGSLNLEQGESLHADPRHVLWADIRDGAISFMGDAHVDEGESLPLASRTWLKAAAAAAGIVIRTSEQIRPSDLTLFNQLALSAISNRFRERWEAERRSSEQNRVSTRGEFDAALRKLAGAAAVRPNSGAAIASHDAFVAVVSEIFVALKLPKAEIASALQVVSQTSARTSADDRLRVVADRLRLGRRGVVLKPDFVSSEGPPLLAWRGPDRSLVALIHKGAKGWQMWDGAGSRPLTNSNRGDLHSDAIQLYPNLALGSLRFRDLFAFGLADVFPDLWRMGFAALTVALIGMFTPVISHVLIDTVIPNGRINLFWTAVAALIAASLGGAAFEFFKGLAFMRAEARFESRLQPALVERLMRLPTSFYRRFTVGDITDRVLGIQHARQMLTGTAAGAVLGGIFGLMSLVPLFFYDARLAWVGLAIVLFTCLTIAGLSLAQLRHQREEVRHRGRLDGFVVQLLVGVAKIRAAAAEQRAMAQWTRYFVAQRDRFVSVQRWNAVSTVVMAVLPVLGTIILFATIGRLLQAAATGDEKTPSAMFSAADFVAFSAAFGQVMGALATMTHSLTEMLATVPLMERSKPIMETAIEVPRDAEPPGELNGGVELRRVKFRYLQEGPLVIDDVSLRIEPGQFVALVGPSGSGKSTIARLILGFERPDVGEVFFGDKSAERLDMAALRQQIGVVLQNGRLSSGSIYENILGDARLGLDDAWTAARLVGLDRDIESMPMGMHTVLLDGGSTLSGGQRQRILIARALVHQPRILLLDEATSALDNRTQGIVTETLGKLSTTRIVIAHRLSTIQAVDQIFVMDRGRVLESGDYDALMARDGAFAALAKRQML